jgi:hypothetical protein
MRRMLALSMMLLLAVLHAPLSAQALMSPFLPVPILTSEPAMLLLTGVTLLSLARVGK